MDSRAATPLPGGSKAWTDAEGGRAFVFDRASVVREVLQGAPRDGLPPVNPWWVVPSAQGLHTVEADGRELRFEGGAAFGWIDPAAGGPRVAAQAGLSVAVRSIMDFPLRSLGRDDPLLWLIDERGGVRGIGVPLEADQAFLEPLVNTGWAVFDGDAVVFASALEPLLRRYGLDGSLQWEARWEPDDPFPSPKFRAVRGGAEPSFQVAQYGIAADGRGRLYVLAASGPDERPTTLLAFNRSGELIGRGEVEEGIAIFTTPRGRLAAVDPASVMARTPESVRAPFPEFDLVRMDGSGHLRLRDLEGHVAVINFWASWCAPCRREMPVLDALARSYDTSAVRVVGLNEDIRVEDGQRFLEELGGVSYPSGTGGGTLREVYGYRGLPFTVVLDGRGRVVRTLYGFGEDLSSIKQLIDSELER